MTYETMPGTSMDYAVSSDREMELKFLVDKAAFKSFQQSTLLGGPSSSPARSLRSVYFDTQDHDLWRHHQTIVRVRDEGGGHILAVKAAGKDMTNPFLRDEIEVTCPTSDPDLALLGEPIAADLGRIIDGKPLRPIFVTEIHRRQQRVVAQGSEIEVAFDTGFIVSGEAREPVLEIELELKSGDAVDLYGLGLALTEIAPVRLGIQTKAARGRQLSTGHSMPAVRAHASLASAHSVDDVIAVTLATCLRQFTDNWPAFEGGDGPEAVHQMRVAMRRLRAALVLFQRSFPCVEFAVMRTDAKRIAKAMAEARNWDVFGELAGIGERGAFRDEPGFAALIAAAEEHRIVGHQTVAALLNGVDVTRFVLSGLAFVARRGWRNSVPSVELPRLSAPALSFAAASLERLHRRVRRHGKGLADMSVSERHELRVSLKALRYASDFFGNLFPQSGSVRSHSRAVARLQDVLGNFNDAAMVTDLVSRLKLNDDLAAARAAGIMVGWYSRGIQSDDHHLLKAWNAFRKAKPFWADALRAAAI